MEQKKLMLRDFYGEDLELIAVETTYANNGRLAVLLYGEDGELFCDLSVNIDYPQSDTDNEGLVFVDTNSYPFLDRFIRENEFGRPTGHTGLSGYCSYPEYRIDVNLLKEIREVSCLW